MIRTAASILALVAAAAVAPAHAQAPAGPAASAPAQSEDARLAAFFDAAYEETLRMSPQGLTAQGRKERYGELNDYTEAAQDRVLAVRERQVERMKREFDSAKLNPASRLSMELFERQVREARENVRWRKHFYAVSSTGGAMNGLPVFLINNHRVDTVADAEAYVARLREAERVSREVEADLDDRTNSGFVPPTFVFARTIPDTQNQLKGAPFDGGPDHPVWADFKAEVAKLQADEATKARLLADGEAALKGEWKRGYDRYLAALGRMQTKATTVNGVWALPDGDAYYAARVRQSTTTDLTPDQVHDIGLTEVARIRDEMEAIKAKVGFQGSLNDFLTFVKTDARFQYPNTPEGKAQYLADARKLIDDYMVVAPKQFHALPKQKLEVRAVEPFREKTAAVAFYNSGAPDGSRPGIFYMNLSDMTQVLKPQMPAIAFHEGAPGHHFQRARQQEQADLPQFRRQGGYGAYSEGWGLYAEKLGKEAGFYQDPYDDLGRLSLELWRAARLVLDTGIHAKRWTRDQAVAYMRENTLNSERDISSEIDRYFTGPGQATSYKIGELKILELRERAKAALGPKFDVRDFHEAVLSEGAVPLDVLERQVDAYVARKR